MPWFDLIGWFSSPGIPEKEVERRYFATAVVALPVVGAFSVSWWAFLHWKMAVATIVCIVSSVIAFIVALWAVGRILPLKTRSEP